MKYEWKFSGTNCSEAALIWSAVMEALRVVKDSKERQKLLEYAKKNGVTIKED